MVELRSDSNEASRDLEAKISGLDAASYIFQLSREMATMADQHGFSRLAAALEQARSLAAEALATQSIRAQSGSGNAAPEDAA